MFLEHERRSIMGREELYRDREYMEARHCRDISPSEYGAHRSGRLHSDRRDLYLEEERDRGYRRSYMESGRCHPEEREAWLANRDMRDCDMRELRDYRNMDTNHIYANERGRERDRERERLGAERERSFGNRMSADWKHEWNSPHERTEWLEKNNDTGRNMSYGANKRSNVVVGSKSNSTALSNKISTNTAEHGLASDGNWKNVENSLDNSKQSESVGINREGSSQHNWMDHENRGEIPINTSTSSGNRQWNQDWRENADNINYQRNTHIHQMRNDRGGRSGYRRGAGVMDHGIERGYRAAHNTATNQSNLLQNQISSGYPRFPNKRLTYMNPNLIKKQQTALSTAKVGNTIPTSGSNVAAETPPSITKTPITSTVTSTTNASTNVIITSTTTNSTFTGINTNAPVQNETTVTNSLPATLSSVSESIKQGDTTSELTAGKPLVTGNTVIENTGNTILDSAMIVAAELSEISDTDDEILNKTDKKKDDTTDTELMSTLTNDNVLILNSAKDEKNNIKDVEDKCDDDLLDFEEISDGELEEDSRNRGIKLDISIIYSLLLKNFNTILGVGDALGVDWASLIAEAKQPTKDITTSAKQKWQTHHIFLDVGISMYLAGESYARQLLNEAQDKLDKELQEQGSSTNINDNSKVNKELIPNNTMEGNDNDVTSGEDLKNNDSTTKSSENIKTENETSLAGNTREIHPLACVQVAKRRSYLEREQLFTNICGPNSRALSARQDLKLRRYLCGLPTNELGLMTAIPKTSDELKAKALSIFRAASEIDVN